jgi:hypothetical protein
VGIVAIGLVAACGGELDLTQRDGGAGQGTEAGAPDGATPSPGSLLFTGGSPGDDAGCSPASSALLLAATDAPSSGSCWSCVAQGCSTQLAACAADCSCNAIVTGELSCLESSGADCLAPFVASDDDATVATNICIQEASIECGCTGSTPDASAGCTALGGGGGGGNGQCTSNVGETCDGTNYQVVCACPEANCVCFSGTSATKTVSFSGCPFCPGGPGPNSGTDLLALCGFPH